MTCKDCIHGEQCGNYFHRENKAEFCGHFHDKSLFVELPCNVGDTIYQTDGVYIYESSVKFILYGGLEKWICHTGDIAFDSTAVKEKRVFLTREEAEKALKESEAMDKINVCKEYIWQLCSITSMNTDGLFSIYGLEQSRIDIHNKLCDIFKIDREKSKDILSHLEKLNIDVNQFPNDEKLETYANKLVEYIESHMYELI